MKEVGGGCSSSSRCCVHRSRCSRSGRSNDGGFARTPQSDVHSVGRVRDRPNSIGVAGQSAKGGSIDGRVPNHGGAVITPRRDVLAAKRVRDRHNTTGVAGQMRR